MTAGVTHDVNSLCRAVARAWTVDDCHGVAGLQNVQLHALTVERNRARRRHVERQTHWAHVHLDRTIEQIDLVESANRRSKEAVDRSSVHVRLSVLVFLVLCTYLLSR